MLILSSRAGTITFYARKHAENPGFLRAFLAVYLQGIVWKSENYSCIAAIYYNTVNTMMEVITVKRFLSLLLSLVLLLTSAAFAEVQVISSPDMAMPVYDGELGNIQIGKGIDLGSCVYMPVIGRVIDEFSTDGSGWAGYHVGRSETSDLLTLEMEVTNLSSSKQIYFRECSVTVTYTNSRGEYVFGGAVRQKVYGHRGYHYEQKDFFAVDPLYVGYYIFYDALPNYVFETEGKVVMNVQMGDQTMTWVYREK